jgi:hypothetical protein
MFSSGCNQHERVRVLLLDGTDVWFAWRSFHPATRVER